MNSTRTRAALAGCLLAVAALAAAGLLIGSFPLSFSEILRDPGGLSARVFWQLRLPRTLMGLAGGWALGMAGGVYQTVFANPLASPDLTGVSGGASLGAAAAIVLGAGGRLSVTLFSFAFGMAALAAVLGLVSTARLQRTGSYLLAGVIVSSLAEAGLMVLKTLADPEGQLGAIESWTMGSLSAVTAEKIILPALLAAGLDSVNISLDTLHPETFRRITGKDELAAVQNGIRAALASGIPVKLNCVPQPGVNEGELESLAAFAQEHPLQVRFIEMMPIGFGAGLPCLSGPELLERFYRRWPQLQPVTGAAFGDGPAVYYSAPGWRGSIGLIAAVHGKFCASCNRVRLTSQGFLRPCLASESGTDLRALLRSGADDAALLQAIQNTILAKPREHHFGQGSMPATRGMYRIGG